MSFWKIIEFVKRNRNPNLATYDLQKGDIINHGRRTRNVGDVMDFLEKTNSKEQAYGIAISSLYGYPASGVLLIDDSGRITARLARKEYNNAFISHKNYENINMTGVTHNFKPFSLLKGIALRNEVNGINCVRQAEIDFHYAVIGVEIKSMESKLINEVEFEIESLGQLFYRSRETWNRKNNSSRTEEYMSFAVDSGATVKVINTLQESNSSEITTITPRTFFRISFESKQSLQEVIDSYVIPTLEFINLTCDKLVNISSMTLRIDSKSFPVTSRIFTNKKADVSGIVDHHDDSAQDALKKYLESFASIKHHTARLQNNDNGIRYNLIELINEVDKVHKTVLPNSATKSYKGKLNQIMEKQSSIMNKMITDKTVWATRVKSHRTYLVHSSETSDYDQLTIEEFYAIYLSLRWLMIVSIFNFLKVDKKLMQSIETSRVFEVSANRIKTYIGAGSIPNDKEQTPQISMKQPEYYI